MFDWIPFIGDMSLGSQASWLLLVGIVLLLISQLFWRAYEPQQKPFSFLWTEKVAGVLTVVGGVSLLAGAVGMLVSFVSI